MQAAAREGGVDHRGQRVAGDASEVVAAGVGDPEASDGLGDGLGRAAPYIGGTTPSLPT